MNFIAGSPPAKIFNSLVKIRYNFKAMRATVKITGEDQAEICFNSAQKAITPGQSAVFYIDDRMIGGGIIIKS